MVAMRFLLELPTLFFVEFPKGLLELDRELLDPPRSLELGDAKRLGDAKERGGAKGLGDAKGLGTPRD